MSTWTSLMEVLEWVVREAGQAREAISTELRPLAKAKLQARAHALDQVSAVLQEFMEQHPDLANGGTVYRDDDGRLLER